MGCLVLLLALISPRVAIIVTWLLTNLLSRAFDSWLVPLVGFFVLPWTTLAYAWMWHSHDRVHGFEWFVVGIAFLADLSSHANSGRLRSLRRR